jgi:hypothetical protein
MKELLKSVSEKTPMYAPVSPMPVVEEKTFAEDELPEEEAFVPEEVFVEEPAEAIAEPEPEPVEEVNPNQMLSADDIAALFAQAEAEAVAEPEPIEEEKPEDAFASSGVDLSDPNKTLSADDIAALFASMGN